MKGRAYVSALSVKRRDALNIAFDDGKTEVTINDDNNVQGFDPGTGRSVDAGGVGWTLYEGAVKVGEGHDALLSYLNNFPYNDLVFEIPGKLRVVQDGPSKNLENGYFEMRFNANLVT